ncbi:MAG: hypothetical protein ABSC16_06575 [Candidatus Dormibacteria bacterium]|jgi:hypothetical protein|nr:hypothetical protein [Chloroflexota bacterium]HBV93500.1 hypothetical protein [Chloroflexota bacterium]
METRKSKRSLRLALVMGAAVAGTALVGWGGLAAWQAYTQNAGNAFAVGTLTHTNTAGESVICGSTNIVGDASSNCAVIVSDMALTSEFNGTSGTVTIKNTGSLGSTFQMSMPAAPGPVQSGDGNLCGYLTLTVTDNETPHQTPYETAPLSTQMGPTDLLASNGDGTSGSPWVYGDSGTYTFAVGAVSGFGSNDDVLGSSCTFDILFTQASA